MMRTINLQDLYFANNRSPSRCENRHRLPPTGAVRRCAAKTALFNNHLQSGSAVTAPDSYSGDAGSTPASATNYVPFLERIGPDGRKRLEKGMLMLRRRFKRKMMFRRIWSSELVIDRNGLRWEVPNA